MSQKNTGDEISGSGADTSPARVPPLLVRLQGGSLRVIEDGFDRYGRFVARHPLAVILFCTCLTAVCGGGLYWFRAENEGFKLWIPNNSDSRLNSDWLFENFPRDIRFSSLIFVGENVLKASSIQAMYRVSKRIRSIRNINNDTWSDMCLQRPVIKVPSLLSILGRKKRDLEFDDFSDDDFGLDVDEVPRVDLDIATAFSIEQYPTPYCGIVEGMPKACFESSILELWGNNGEYDEVTEQEIDELTDEQVIVKVNGGNQSGIFLTPFNFSSLLSRVTRDEAGRIVGAEATYAVWLGRMNMTEAKVNPAPGRGEPIDPRMLQWEGDMVDAMLDTSHYPQDLKSYPNVQRSFGDIASDTIIGDVSFFGAGYMMMFGYVGIMLGRFNAVEHRNYLSMVGIMGVIMGIIVSYGICSAAGLFYGPMHSVMPFLMLGIGIDDMFVIVQCLNNLSQEEKKRSMPERFGQVMRHAGAAITVTSATDVIAFGVGGFTILPALQSFCIYASVGIVATFIFQSSFFLACLVLDQRRIESHRNGCCPCYVHTNHQLNEETKNGFLQQLFKILGKLLMLPVLKVGVVIVTLAVTGCGIWGNVLLRQEFDPTWFLPSDTYISQWFVNNKIYFPSSGERGTVYFNGADLPTEIPKIESLMSVLGNQTDIIKETDSWTTRYIEYIDQMGGIELGSLDKSSFHSTLAQFLYSPKGAVYQNRFRFKGNLTCGQPAPEILLSETTFTHRLFSGPEEHVPAMNRVKHFVRQANITGKVFAMALGYAPWETDEIISLEVYRNIALATLCVFFTTLFFVSNFAGAVYILLCVCLTLVDVGGFMHFWGLTIDTVSCNNLIIAIGLCVDYSAHIMHRFLIEVGDRELRVVNTLYNIGPAVFNGGFSTFLAFILLATSKSHVFSSFFKIFFLVVAFGLFHGLIFLPVLLSYFGPDSMHNETGAVVGHHPVSPKTTRSGAANGSWEKGTVAEMAVLTTQPPPPDDLPAAVKDNNGEEQGESDCKA